MLLNQLQHLTEHLKIENQVDFKTDLSLPEVIRVMSKAKVGIHTMWNEHFGIGVVEMMAAGLVVVAHASGGPLDDIVLSDSTRGYLADTEESYANSIELGISSFDFKRHKDMRMRCRKIAMEKFSDEAFCRQVKKLMDQFLT